MNNVDKFIHGHSGKRLLSKHSLEDYGLWRVRGEDPNCDLGGHHHEPELGIFEGKLRDVIAYAVRLPGWYQWGSGGSIESYLPRNIRKITSESVAELDAKAAKKAKIQAERDRLTRMLEELEDDC